MILGCELFMFKIEMDSIIASIGKMLMSPHNKHITTIQVLHAMYFCIFGFGCLPQSQFNLNEDNFCL